MTDSAARQLNVADALIYLDLVENRFRERPEVYNQFLDIMKEYKGQTYVICCLQNFLAAKNEQNWYAWSDPAGVDALPRTF